MEILIQEEFRKKRLNQSENIPKSFSGLFFWNTLYNLCQRRHNLELSSKRGI